MIAIAINVIIGITVWHLLCFIVCLVCLNNASRNIYINEVESKVRELDREKEYIFNATKIALTNLLFTFFLIGALLLLGWILK